MAEVALFDRNLRQDVATGGVREANQSHVFDSPSPSPGEGRVSRIRRTPIQKVSAVRSEAGCGASRNRTARPDEESCDGAYGESLFGAAWDGAGSGAVMGNCHPCTRVMAKLRRVE